MSKIDQRYINNLQKFTDALESLVEQMKEQQKEGTKDVVNEMLNNVPDKLSIVIDNQKEIIKKQKDIKSDTSKILQEIKNIKKKEETGMFSKISDTDNKKKVVDAVKAIILIAGAVLAIGMAFKIVGKVDFASVVGLSLSILIMVEAFKKISEMDIGVGDVLFSGLMIVLVSGSLLAAGFILSAIPPLDPMQGLSILLIAGTVGIATWLIMKAVNKVNVKKNWAKILLLPLMLPLVATGILLSGYLLTKVPVMSWEVGLSALIVAATMGVAAYLILGAVATMDINIKKDWPTILLLPIMLPLIAAGIVLSSIVFQEFVPISNPWELLKGSLVIGLSLLIMTPTIILIGKFVGKSWQALFSGVIAIPFISASILAVSWIYQLLPDQFKSPDLSWSLDVGIGMLLFLPTMLIVGAIGMTGIGIGVLAIGLIGLPLIALSMVAVSNILNSGNWVEGSYPSLEWVFSVGTGLLLFGMATILAAPVGLVSGIFSFFAGEDPLVKLAKSMVSVSDILKGQDWGNYPNLEWAMGVGTSLLLFGTATILAAPAGLVSGILSWFSGDDEDPLEKLAKSIVKVSKILSTGAWETGYPSKEWAEGVGGSLMMFAKAFAHISDTERGGLFDKDKDFNVFITKASLSMVLASYLLKGGAWSTGYPSKKWAEGVGGSLTKFAEAFSTIAEAERGGWFDKSKDFNSFIMKAATSMVLASYLLQPGVWDIGYPSEEWAKGVGGSLMSFAEVFKSVADVERGGWFDKSKDFNSFIMKSSAAISLASVMLSSGVSIDGKVYKPNWKSDYPDTKWAKGVGGALNTFAEAFKDITEIEEGGWFSKDKDFSMFVRKAASAMTLASIKLAEGDWSKYPEKTWSDNVSYGLLEIAKVVDDADLDMDEMEEFEYFLKHIVSTISTLADFPDMDPFTMNFEKFLNTLNNIPEDKYKGLERLSESMRDFGDSLKNINLDTAQAISSIGQGSLLLTIIDEEKLKNVLDLISNKSSELKEISGEEKGLLRRTEDYFGGLFSGEEKKDKKETVAEIEDNSQAEFYDNVATIRNIMEEIRDIMEAPGQMGTFNK